VVAALMPKARLRGDWIRKNPADRRQQFLRIRVHQIAQIMGPKGTDDADFHSLGFDPISNFIGDFMEIEV
jgi:hypothetical protein